MTSHGKQGMTPEEYRKQKQDRKNATKRKKDKRKK